MKWIDTKCCRYQSALSVSHGWFCSRVSWTLWHEIVVLTGLQHSDMKVNYTNDSGRQDSKVLELELWQHYMDLTEARGLSHTWKLKWWAMLVTSCILIVSNKWNHFLQCFVLLQLKVLHEIGLLRIKKNWILLVVWIRWSILKQQFSLCNLPHAIFFWQLSDLFNWLISLSMCHFLQHVSSSAYSIWKPTTLNWSTKCLQFTICKERAAVEWSVVLKSRSSKWEQTFPYEIHKV